MRRGQQPGRRRRPRRRRAPPVVRRAGRPGRRPARRAPPAAARRRCAASRRGPSPTRPAEVRPVSSTSSTWRSRSGPPRAHHHVGGARARPPVDRAHVVADDVLAQRVELGALAADHRRRAPVELAQPRQPAGQVLAGAERRQDPHASTGRPARGLPGGAARAGRARRTRDEVAGAVAASGRAQGHRRAGAAPGRQVEGEPVGGERRAEGGQASRTRPRARRRRRAVLPTVEHDVGGDAEPDRRSRRRAAGSARGAMPPGRGPPRRGRAGRQWRRARRPTTVRATGDDPRPTGWRAGRGRPVRAISRPPRAQRGSGRWRAPCPAPRRR